MEGVSVSKVGSLTPQDLYTVGFIIGNVRYFKNSCYTIFGPQILAIDQSLKYN